MPSRTPVGIQKNGAEPIYLEQQSPINVSLSDVIDGDVVVVRRGLQTIGLYDTFAENTLDELERMVSRKARDYVEEHGFESMHRAMTVPAAFRTRAAINNRLEPLSLPLITSFIDALADSPHNVYACTAIYVRMMMPEDVVAAERELLAEEFGHMIVHAPHRDSWFSHCRNTINLWAAIGPVKPGNGMLVYPEARDRVQRRVGTRIDPGEPLGRPMNFDMGPGDVIVFNGEHMHSSEVNITDETRYVVTVRLCLGPPRYAHGNGWVPYYRLSLMDGPLRPFASLRSRLTVSRVRHLARKTRRRWNARTGRK